MNIKIVNKYFAGYLAIVIFTIFISSACNKLIEVNPPDVFTSSESIYSSDANSIALLNGIYASMSSNSLSEGNTLNSFMSLYPGLSADEFTLFDGVNDGRFFAYYHNDLSNFSEGSIWSATYNFINRINVAIIGLSNSKTLTEKVRIQLLGEAKFIRAFHYFYIVNLYGPVPLVLTDDYKKNALLPRSSVDDVYQQIIADLLDAESKLSEIFVGNTGFNESTERVVPTSWAAKSLLARVYLYTKNYEKAIELSSDVINHSALFNLTDISGVFLKNSREAIWQLQPVNLGWNTEDARLFVIPSTGPSNTNPVYLSDSLLISFEKDDRRKSNWIDTAIANGSFYYYSNKYRSAKLDAEVTEYHMVLRLAEQYLIRAEANAQLNNLQLSIDDLNQIRNRAGLPNYLGQSNKSDVLDAVYHERRVEFFAEWGHRWLDLKRTEMVNEVMHTYSIVKNGTWNSYDQYYPIPRSDLTKDPNLVQNEGY
jgi:hypothetical protein